MRVGNINGEINDLYQTIYDSGELGAAVTSISITGLEGDIDKEYKLIIRGIDKDTTGYWILRFNSDSDSNYGYQRIKAQDSSASASRGTSSTLMYVGLTETDGNITFSETDIYAVSGNERTVISCTIESITGTTVASLNLWGQVWNNIADEITSMTIAVSADEMAIGSRIILLKKVDATSGMKTGALDVQGSVTGAWEKIYENDIASAVQTVTVSNLTGDTDVLYRMITYAVNDNATASSYAITFNNDTATNYGRQYLVAYN